MADVAIIKIYNNIDTIPEELIYLSQHHENHYFYQDCYLGHCCSGKFNISIIKCKKADGDISNLSMTINDYNNLDDAITDELFRMHENGLVHMDIKTTNILYKKYQTGIKFGLCDFELVNNMNIQINNIFGRYYYKLYHSVIPHTYTDTFENYAFGKTLDLMKNNKKIKYNSI